MWPHLLAFAVGAWLTAAPDAVGLTGPAAANLHVVGPLAAAAGLVAVFQATRPVRWLNLPLGAWLAVSPLAVPAGGGGVAAHHLAAGLALAALATVRGPLDARMGGGWAADWRGQPTEVQA